MDLLTWIQEYFPAMLKQDIPWQLTFVTPSYPTLFLEHIKKVVYAAGYQLTSLSSSDSIAGIEEQLHTGWIGLKKHIYLFNMVQADQATLRVVEKVLASYEGPHNVLMLSARESAVGKSKVVTLPDLITYPDYCVLFKSLHPSQGTGSSALIKKVFKKYGHLSLEQAFHLMRYHPILGSKYNEEEQTSAFLDEIIAPSHSLFRLSGHLFAGDKKEFLEMWAHMHEEYGAQFWISFWSDQLFRAYWFADAMHARNKDAAQRISPRLPFSFTQRDWKKMDTKKISKAHAFLYRLDNRIKNGSPPLFETFFMHIL